MSKKGLHWEYRSHTTEKTTYLSWSRLLFCGLMIFSAASLLPDVFPNLRLTAADIWKAELFAAVLFLVQEGALPFAKKAKVPVLSASWFPALLSGVYLGGFLCFYLWNRKRLESGILQIGTDYLTRFNKYYKTAYAVPAGDPAEVSGTLLFGLLLLYTLFWILTMLRRKWLWMASLPVLILILELLVGKAPGWKGLGLLLFGVILYASGEWDSCAPNVCHEKSTKRTNASVRRMLSRAAVCIIAGILLWTGAGWFQKPVNAILKKSPEMLQFQHDLEQRISSVKLPFFKNKVSITNQRPKYQDKEVLQVESTKEVDGNLYFRNFYGTDYENGSWRCDMADYAQAAQKADSLPQETAFELAGRLYWAAEQDQTDYTITYTDGWGSDACIPYFTDLEHAKGISVVDDGRAKKGFFKKTTSISGRNNNTDLYRFLMNRIYQEEEEDAKLEWYDQYAKRFVEEPNDTKLADILFGYQIDAGFYRGMYQTGSAQDRNENRLILASLVSELLDERCSYSLNLSDIPEGEDAVEYFLSKNREGYCMHFASAGALVLRECGIPARYASGYIVKAKDFKKNADGGYTASVKDRNAHAWVEIYLDGIGWVPIEMTPGFGTKESKLPTETKDKPAGQTQNENENDSDSETETQTETESESETEELPENETEQKPAHMSQTTAQTASAAKTALKFLGLAAAVLLLAGLLFWQGKRALRRFRMQIEKDLKRKNYKRAVKRMNRRLYRKLLYTGKIRKQNLTDREYERVLAKSYPQISEADWAGFMRIAKEAAFSAHEISREDAEFCYRLYRRCRILKEK